MYFWVLHVATSKPKLKEFNLETVCITLFSIFLPVPFSFFFYFFFIIFPKKSSSEKFGPSGN